MRYYSPSLGRWTQQDPLAGSLFDLNSANRYVYAGDDPVNQTDPSGKNCATDVFVNVILGSIGGLLTIGSALYGIVSYLSALPEGLAAAAAAPEILPTVLGIATGLGLAIAALVLAYAVTQVIDECLGLPFVFQLF